MRAAAACALVFSSAVATTAVPARASEPPPAAAALRQARAAWERGSFASAEPLYREAIEKGGLAPDEVLEGYVRLGAMRASAGKKDQAIAAFRAASILDATFAVPAEAGAKGPALAAQAKKDTQKFGSIKLTLEAPREARPGKPVRVTAHLDTPHLPIVSRVALLARDGTTGKEISREAKPEASMDFEVPSELALPNASILVRVDALDPRANRLASAEEKVKIDGDTEAVAAEGGPGGSGAFTAGSSPPPGADSPRKGGSFWSSPWPYLIGGIAAAGAGAAIYFGTRTPENVAVGPVGVQTR